MRTYDVRILSVDTFCQNDKGYCAKKSLLFRNIVHKHKWSPNASESTETDIISTNAVRQAILRLKSLQISPMPKTFGESIETSRNKKNCATKLHLRGDFYDPHLLTRGSPKNGVSASQGLPELRRASAAADSFAPGQTSGACWCAEGFRKVNPPPL
jgi:hypothetical protein